MNAPIRIAQAGTQQAAEKVTVITLEKPAGGQAVTVKTGYEGKVKLDFSKIADDRITIVRVGETAVIFFHDNKSTITLDPFFGSGTEPLAFLEFDLGGNRIFTAEQIASILPFTVYQGILPAAGEGGSDPQDSGANFNPANVENLPPIVLNELMPPEELPPVDMQADVSPFIFGGTPPVFGLIETAFVDEDFLKDGNKDLPVSPASLGDDDGTFFQTKIITITNWGDGGTNAANRKIFFTNTTVGVTDETGATVAQLKSNNDDVSYALLDGPAGPNTVLVAYTGGAAPTQTHYNEFKNGDPSTFSGRLVFIVEIDFDGTDWSYTFTLLDQLDHPFTDDPSTDSDDATVTSYEDNFNFLFSVTAQNGLGLTGSTTFTAVVDDDSPYVDIKASHNNKVVHDETPGKDGDADDTTLSSVANVFKDVAFKGSDNDLLPWQKSFFGAIGYAKSGGPLVSFFQKMPGADLPDSTKFELVLNGSGPVFSGLKTTEGRNIYLFLEDGIIVGRYDSPTDGDTVVTNTDPAAFAIAINPVTGEVYVAQWVSLWHPIAGPTPWHHDDWVSLSMNTVGVKVTLTDNDNDSHTDVAYIGHLIKFEDDGPEIKKFELKGNAKLVHDETPGKDSDADDLSHSLAVFNGVTNKGNDPDVKPGDKIAGAIGFAKDQLIDFSKLLIDYGSDGPADSKHKVFSLQIKGGNGIDSGLKTTEGYPIRLYMEGDVLVGRVWNPGNPLHGKAAFAIAVDPNTGEVSLVQWLSLQHPIGGASHDEEIGFNLGFGKAIEIKLTVKDGDNDTDSKTVDITGKIKFQDDGPEAKKEENKKVLDDEAQAGGINGGPGDQTGPNLKVATGKLVFDAGSDGLKSIAVSTTVTVKNGNNANVPLKGIYVDPVTKVASSHDIVLNWVAGQNAGGGTSGYQQGGTLFGKMLVNGNWITVFTLEVESDGDYKLTLLGPLQHPLTGSGSLEDDLKLIFEYIVTDGDNDTAKNTITFTVDDDSPAVGTNKTVFFDDEAATTPYGTPNEGGLGDFPGANPPNPTATGTLSFNPGADGIGSVLLTGFTLNTSYAGSPHGEFQQSITDGGTVLTIQQKQDGVWVDVIKVTLEDTTSGKYTIEQLKPLFHPTPQENEENVEFTIKYEVTDGDGDKVGGSFKINIDDDTPVAFDECATAEVGVVQATKLDLVIVLDISQSMSATVPGMGSTTRLDLAKQALLQLVNNPDVDEVNIVLFRGAAYQTGWISTDEASLLTFINAITVNSITAANTNYDAALFQNGAGTITVGGKTLVNKGAVHAFDTDPSTDGDDRYVFFLSDGEPNAPGGSAGINATEEGQWINFLTTHEVKKSFAVGFGEATRPPLEPIAWDGTTDPKETPATYTGANDPHVIIIPPQQLPNLAGVLEELITPVDGNVLSNGDSFGADGGHIQSIKIGNDVYNHDHEDVSSSGKLVVTTSNGGTFTFYFLDTLVVSAGDWHYVPPTTATGPFDENIIYTLVDGDGDPAQGLLKIKVSLLPPQAPGDGIALTVYEEALDDTGSNPTSSNETDDGVLTFTQGSLPLTFAFRDPGDPNVVSQTPVVTDADGDVINLFWQLSDGKLIGYLGSVGDPDDPAPLAKVIELTLVPGTPSGGQVPVTVTATLFGNFPDHSDLNIDNITITNIVVQGTDGTTTVDGTVEVTVVDDVPDADPDTNTVSEGQTLTVLAASGVLANDTAGADGYGAPQIVGVEHGNDPSNPVSGGVGSAIAGANGTLTLNADGSYSYVANSVTNGQPDVFVYTIQDGDGDVSTTTLTITTTNVSGGLASVTAAAENAYEDDDATTAGQRLNDGTDTQLSLTFTLEVTTNDPGDPVDSAIIGGIPSGATGQWTDGTNTVNFAPGSTIVTGANAAEQAFLTALKSGTNITVTLAEHDSRDVTISLEASVDGTATNNALATTIVDTVAADPTLTDPADQTVDESGGANTVFNVTVSANFADLGDTSEVRQILLLVPAGFTLVSVTGNGATLAAGTGTTALPGLTDPQTGQGYVAYNVTPDSNGNVSLTVTLNGPGSVTSDVSGILQIVARSYDPATDLELDLANNVAYTTQQVSLTVKNTNDKLVITGTAHGTVEEEDGLPGGLEDTTDLDGNDTDGTGPQVTRVFLGVLSNQLTIDGDEGALSFKIADIVGQVPVQAGGSPLTSGDQQVYFHKVSDTQLVGYVDSGAGNNGTYGAGDKLVFTLVITNQTTGAYTFTLEAPIDHPITTGEDTLTIDLGGRVLVTDTGDTGDDALISSFTVDVIDDAPVAKDDFATAELGETVGVTPFHLTFLIDVSASISVADMRLALAGFLQLTQTYAAAGGDLSIEVIRFRGTADAPGTHHYDNFGGPKSIDSLIALLTTASASNAGVSASMFAPGTTLSSGTNYLSGLTSVRSYLNTVDENDGFENVFYFFTDGDPTAGITSVAQMNNFLAGDPDGAGPLKSMNAMMSPTSLGLQIHAFGVGSGMSANGLNILGAIDNTSGSPIQITNFEALLPALVGTVDPNPADGNVLSSVGEGFGADGGYIKSIEIDGVIYTFDGTGSISVSGATPPAGHSFNTSGGTLIEGTTALGGTFTFYFANTGPNNAGKWTYTAPELIPASMAGGESFTYTLVDGDGDTASAKLNIVIPPSISVEGDTVQEDAGQAQVFTVALSHITAAPIAVNLTLGTVGDTAIGGGTDYGPGFQYSTDGGSTWETFAANPVVIPAGASALLVRTHIVDDTAVEGDETFSLSVQVVSGHTSNNTANGTATIKDNDNAAPVANNDTINGILEAAHTNNASGGGTGPTTGTPSGSVNVLANDADPGDTLTVTSITPQGGSTTAVVGTVTVLGTYGWLTIGANGAATYTLDNTLAATQALQTGQAVTDVFTYEVTDSGGLTDTANITVNVAGANDAPVIWAPDAFNYLSSGTPGTPLNQIKFSDVDSTGPVTVTLSTGDTGGRFFAVGGNGTVNGVTAGGDNSISMTLTGTIAAINVYLAENRVTYDMDDNDADTITVSINTGAGPNNQDTQTFTIDNISGGTSNVDYPGSNIFNIHDTTRDFGGGNDTVVTGWSHVGGSPTTYIGGPGGGNTDTLRAVFTADQLNEVLNTSLTTVRNFYDGTPSSGMDLGSSSWNAIVSNDWEIAQLGLAAPRDTVGADNYYELDTWAGVIGTGNVVTKSFTPNATVGGTTNPDVIVGGASGQTLNGGNGTDVLVAFHQAANTLNGGAGADLLLGGDSDDILNGGTGNDILAGGKGADTFVATDIGSANRDTIVDYNFTEGDVLDLTALLGNFDPGEDLSQFLNVSTVNTNDLLVRVNQAGGGTWGAGNEVFLLAGAATNSADPLKILIDNTHYVVTG